MASIGGVKKTNQEGEFVKSVGIFQAKVVKINPSLAEIKEITGIEPAEDSKQADYIGESKDGNTTLRLDFWLEEVSGKRFKVGFYLEDKIRENKDGTKTQFINNIGNCSWAEDEDSLPAWFTKRDFREAHTGEEEFYEFLRIWLGALDFRSSETELVLDWKKLMKGNVKDLKEQIEGEWAVNFLALATIKTVEKEGEIKEYQNVYNRLFLPVYCEKFFKAVDYENPVVLAAIKSKDLKDQKLHEKFVLKITGEYGCKDYFQLKPLCDYDSSMNPMASSEAMPAGDIDDEDASY